MALLRVESFDHYATADLSMKGWTAAGGTVAVGAYGRNSTNGLRLSTGTNGQANATLSSLGTVTGDTCVVGFAFKQGTAFSASVPVVGVMVGSTPHVFMVLTTSGTLAVYRTSGGTLNPGSATLLGATAAVISSSVYYFIELKVKIHDSTGTVDVKVDGVSELSLTSQDTRNSATATWDSVKLGNDYAMGAFTATRDYDDVYVCDGSSGTNDTFLGDHRIVCAVASSGNGTHTDWSCSTGSDHGALVDENPTNVSDYNQSGTAGHRDSYNFAALGVAGTVRALQTVNLLKADAAGVRYVGDLIRISSSNYDSAGRVVGSDWSYRCEVHPTSPATSTAWTVSEIDGAEFGVKVTT